MIDIDCIRDKYKNATFTRLNFACQLLLVAPPLQTKTKVQRIDSRKKIKDLLYDFADCCRFNNFPNIWTVQDHPGDCQEIISAVQIQQEVARFLKSRSVEKIMAISKRKDAFAQNTSSHDMILRTDLLTKSESREAPEPWPAHQEHEL